MVVLDQWFLNLYIIIWEDPKTANSLFSPLTLWGVLSGMTHECASRIYISDGIWLEIPYFRSLASPPVFSISPGGTLQWETPDFCKHSPPSPRRHKEKIVICKRRTQASEKPTLVIPWSWASSLPNFGEVNFYCLSSSLRSSVTAAWANQHRRQVLTTAPGEGNPRQASSTELLPGALSPATAMAAGLGPAPRPGPYRESMRSMQGRTFSSYWLYRLPWTPGRGRMGRSLS